MALRALLDSGYKVGSCCLSGNSADLEQITLRNLLKSSPGFVTGRKEARALKRKWKKAPPAPALLRKARSSSASPKKRVKKANSTATTPSPKKRVKKGNKLEIIKTEEESNSLFKENQVPLYYSYEFIIGHGLRNRDKYLEAGPPGSLRPFVCPVPHCPKTYKNANGLKYHAQHGHSPPQCFLCHKCSKKYTTRNGLQAHLKDHARKESATATGGEGGQVQAPGVGMSCPKDEVDAAAAEDTPKQEEVVIKQETNLYRVQRLEPFSSEAFFMTLPVTSGVEAPQTISESTLAQLSFSVGSAIAKGRDRSRSRSRSSIISRRSRRDILVNSEDFDGIVIKHEDYGRPECVEKIEQNYQDMVTGMDDYIRVYEDLGGSQATTTPNLTPLEMAIAAERELDLLAYRNFGVSPPGSGEEDGYDGVDRFDINWIFDV